MSSISFDVIWSFIKRALDWFISKPSILFGIAVVCIVMVALPKSYREYLGYDELINSYRGFISLSGLASGVLWVVAICKKFIAIIIKKWQEWRFDKNAPNILRNLTTQEKSYLAKYIAKDVSTLDFEISDGVINGLQKKCVVYQASSISSHHYNWDFNLQPWVSNALEKYPDLKDDILKHYEPDIEPV